MDELRGRLHLTRWGARPSEGSPQEGEQPAPADPARLRAAEAIARARFAAVLGAGGAESLLAVRRPGGSPVLGTHRLVRAGLRLTELDAGQADAVGEELSAANPTLAAYLALLLATGRSRRTTARFLAAVQTHRNDARWLHNHLSVLGGNVGPATFSDDDGARLRLRAQSPAHGGAVVMILLRVLVDPAFALWLTIGTRLDEGRDEDGLPFEQRFRAQQDAVAAAVNRRVLGPAPWPRFLGAPPWALTRFINRFTGLTGGRFAWVPLADAAANRRIVALEAAAAAAAAGLPVPLYLGGPADGGVFLILGVVPPAPGGAALLRCYDPAAGQVVDVGMAALKAGDAGLDGFDRLDGLMLPQLML